MHTDTIIESELIDNLKNNAVTLMRLVQMDQSDEPTKSRLAKDTKLFRIYVRLSWKEGEILLVTQRKTPREWASLDRLVRHIVNHYGPVPPITLHLRGENSESTSHQRLQQE